MNHTVSLYRCTKCDHPDRAAEAHQFDDDPYIGMMCPVCGNESVEFVRERPARFVGVAVYEVDRAYGGPEEGGWYYDCGEVIPETVRCFEAGDAPQMEDYKALLRRRYRDNPRQVDGRLHVRTFTEVVPPAGFPSQRPRYS